MCGNSGLSKTDYAGQIGPILTSLSLCAPQPRPLLRTSVFVYTLTIDIKVMTSKFRIIMTLSTFNFFI